MLKKIAGKVVAVATPLSLAAGKVFAEVPSSVTSAIETTKTDAVSVAAAMIGITAALLVFVYIRRQMH
jgi:hypothetical protein